MDYTVVSSCLKQSLDAGLGVSESDHRHGAPGYEWTAEGSTASFLRAPAPVDEKKEAYMDIQVYMYGARITASR